MNKYYCKDCGIELNNKTRWNETKRCPSCAAKFRYNNGNHPFIKLIGKHSHNYKEIDKKCRCKNCGNKISRSTYYRGKRCKSCAAKIRVKLGLTKIFKSGKLSQFYKHGLTKNHSKYIKWRLKTDINFRICNNLRVKIHHAMKNLSKSAHTKELLGCSIEELKTHLASKFTKRMSWDNYGTGYNGKGMEQWHIDHIRPCASFDLSKASEQKKCFNYTNLQPLWAKDNLEKSDKYDYRTL
jgi:hypothetical protein